MSTVLVVDDDPLSLRLMEIALRRLGGFDIRKSTDPAEILALAKSGQVDAIVMDVSLIDSEYEGRYMDGVEISRILKSDAASSKVPVLLSTAHAMRGDEERLLKASGADGYLAKPIPDPMDLVRALRKLLA